MYLLDICSDFRDIWNKFLTVSVKDFFIAISVPCLWGFGLAISKPGMEQLPPMLINGLRWMIAGLVLVWWFPIPKKIMKEITEEAKSVVDDYVKNPSKISGSAEIRIHENSPWLDENKPFIPLTNKNVDKKK